MIRSARITLLPMLLSAVAMSAQAATNLFEGHASINDLTFQVVDLRPEDGIAAAFLPGKNTIEGSTIQYQNVYVIPYNDDYYYFNEEYPAASTSTKQVIKDVFGGPDFQFSLPGSQTGFGRTSGDYSANVVVQASALSEPEFSGFLGSGYGAEMTISTASWVLKPGTEVRIAGVVDLFLHKDLTQLTPEFDGLNLYQFASAWTYVAFDVSGDPTGVMVSPSSALTRIKDLRPVSEQVDQSEFESFLFVARNLGDTDIVINSQFAVGTNFVVSGPIPEPSSMALLAAGCGLLAWRARRSRT